VACGPSGVTPPDVSPDPATASMTIGRFVLDFTIDRTTVRPKDTITGLAKVSLLGPTGATVSGSSTMFGFEFFEIGGSNRHVVPVFDADCAPHRLTANGPLESPILVTGSAPQGDPNAAWYREFLAAAKVHLPIGDWDVIASASFFDGQNCAGQHVDLRATVRVHVIE
jgi:hypothetical protein